MRRDQPAGALRPAPRLADLPKRSLYVGFGSGDSVAKAGCSSAIMLDYNSPYSRGLTDYFELSFTKLGGQVVSKQSYTQGDADFKGQLSSIAATAT